MLDVKLKTIAVTIKINLTVLINGDLALFQDPGFICFRVVSVYSKA